MTLLDYAYNYFGILQGDTALINCIVTIVIFLALGFLGARLILTSAAIIIAMWAWGLNETSILVTVMILAILNIPILRRTLITRWIFKFLEVMKFLPTISPTEQTAIESGTVWIDADLFSGKPNFKKIESESYPDLSPEEKAFLDGPVQDLCNKVDDWVVHQNRGFDEAVWTHLKTQKFFGMIIPKKYGGLEFSALGHSAVISKLATCSSPLAITVMVPNSLGPAELLIHYGTQDQKDYYLPRLATGEEIPCFGLTEPLAGSDAGAIQSNGVIFKDKAGNIQLKLNWKKRYITLGAISTVIGLAFKCYDPDNILGKGQDLGITCALIPSNTKGVDIGRRHDPLGVPFYNCPIEGHDVIISTDQIIGGISNIGKGWQMLTESLAAGRGISLPSTSAGGAKYIARVAGDYAFIREQFGLNIGKFEGIEEPLSKIGGLTYAMDAMRVFVCGAIDKGSKPAVVTAIAKYNATESLRHLINHAMDILGGAAISKGPRNLLAHSYYSVPIGITVEGANILTRTLIIFGQGAIRCHPYALEEIQALQSKNITKFDTAFFKHIGHVIRNKIRSILLTLTLGHLASAPKGKLSGYYKKLSWVSANFAFFSDVAMGLYGGNLKRKERLTGRFSDVLSWMFICTAILRRYKKEGESAEHKAIAQWGLEYGLYQINTAFQEIFQNMGGVFKLFSLIHRVIPFGKAPSDSLSAKVAEFLQEESLHRDALTDGIFIPDHDTMGLARYEHAFKSLHAIKPLKERIKSAVKSKIVKKQPLDSLIEETVAKGIISKEEKDLFLRAEQLRYDAILVDDFTEKDYKKN